MELPKIISVDDHVVEPPHVWENYLPATFVERGPQVKRGKFRTFTHKTGARYNNESDEDGIEGDSWTYEDRLIYVHKKFVAIPVSATPDVTVESFDRTVMQMEAVTYDGMRPGSYDRDSRVEDFENNWMVEEWCGPSGGMNVPLCIMPLWDVDLATTEIERRSVNGVHAFAFTELPDPLKLPSIHSGG